MDGLGGLVMITDQTAMMLVVLWGMNVYNDDDDNEQVTFIYSIIAHVYGNEIKYEKGKKEKTLS